MRVNDKIADKLLGSCKFLTSEGMTCLSRISSMFGFGESQFGLANNPGRHRLCSMAYNLIISLLILMIVGVNAGESVASPMARVTTIDNDPVEHELPALPSSFQTGIRFAQEGDYPAALIAFSKAIQSDARLTDAYANRCLIFLQMSHYHEAIADCDKAIVLQPDHMNARLNRGLALYRQGNQLKAVRDFTAVLNQRPYDVQARYNRGLAEAIQGQHAQAIEDFNQALRHANRANDLTLANIYSDRGITRLQQGNAVGAIADLSMALRFNDETAQIYYNRACAYHLEGHLWQARQDFTAALARDPGFAQAYFNRGMLYRQLGQSERAIADLKAAAHRFEEQGASIAQHNTIKLIRQLHTHLSAIG
ncbi:MAG: tetratricopeptide repeat protein [Cyanobacteria bacterium P01_A01_bin.37]